MSARPTVVVVTLTADQVARLRAVALRRGVTLECLLLERWRIKMVMAGAKGQR